MSEPAGRAGASKRAEEAGEAWTARAEPWLATLLRTLVYLITAAVVAFPLAVPEGVLGATIGATLGATIGALLARSALRLHVILAVALGVLALTSLLGAAFVSSAIVAGALGPSLALRLGDLLSLLGFAMGASIALRAASMRHRSLAILEVVVVALGFASLVASHRNGAIHRPYAIADPILTRGGDPSVAILVIGAMAVVVIGMLLLSERSLLRSMTHVVLVFALLFVVLLTTHLAGLPPPPPANDGLALRDDTSEGGGGGGSSGQRGDGSGAPDFQDEYDQSGARSPVAIVLLHDDYSPPSGQYYFRQGAFSRFNGRRLVRAEQAGVDEDVAPGFPSRSTPIPGAPEAGRFRTTVETTVGLLADHPRPFGLESPILFLPATNPDASRFRRVFRVRSASLTADEWSLVGRAPFDPSWSPEVRELYTRGPDDPRYRELAERTIHDLPDELRDDPYVRALAVTSWLSEHGTYSLRSRHAQAADPTADFLFGDLTGYCVHFAHATVFLLRALGLPARVATGYLVPESSRRGGSAILVSGSSSHAWPEVYLEGVGWVIVDVAPQRALDAPPGEPDEELQQVLAELLRGNRIIPDDGSSPPTPLTELARDLRRMLTSLAALVLLALLALLYVAKLYRRLAPRFVRSPALARVSLREALDRLAELGIVREDGESRERFAERERARLPSLATLSRLAEAARYGGALPSDLVAQTRRARASLARERAGVAPRWRLWLAVIDPFSWLRTR